MARRPQAHARRPRRRPPPPVDRGAARRSRSPPVSSVSKRRRSSLGGARGARSGALVARSAASIRSRSPSAPQASAARSFVAQLLVGQRGAPVIARRARAAPPRGASARRSHLRERRPGAARRERLGRRQAERRAARRPARRRGACLGCRAARRERARVARIRAAASRSASATGAIPARRPPSDGEQRGQRVPRSARGTGARPAPPESRPPRDRQRRDRAPAARRGSHLDLDPGGSTSAMARRRAVASDPDHELESIVDAPADRARAGCASTCRGWRPTRAGSSIGRQLVVALRGRRSAGRRSCGCCRPSRASTICSRGLRIVYARGGAGTREAIVLLPAGRRSWADAVAQAARLAGGQLFTGAGKHFVQFRDARAPLGYDVDGAVATGPGDLILLRRRADGRLPDRERAAAGEAAAAPVAGAAARARRRALPEGPLYVTARRGLGHGGGRIPAPRGGYARDAGGGAARGGRAVRERRRPAPSRRAASFWIFRIERLPPRLHAAAVDDAGARALSAGHRQRRGGGRVPPSDPPRGLPGQLRRRSAASLLAARGDRGGRRCRRWRRSRIWSGSARPRPRSRSGEAVARAARPDLARGAARSSRAARDGGRRWRR